MSNLGKRAIKKEYCGGTLQGEDQNGEKKGKEYSGIPRFSALLFNISFSESD